MTIDIHALLEKKSNYTKHGKAKIWIQISRSI